MRPHPDRPRLLIPPVQRYPLFPNLSLRPPAQNAPKTALAAHHSRLGPAPRLLRILPAGLHTEDPVQGGVELPDVPVGEGAEDEVYCEGAEQDSVVAECAFVE